MACCHAALPGEQLRCGEKKLANIFVSSGGGQKLRFVWDAYRPVKANRKSQRPRTSLPTYPTSSWPQQGEHLTSAWHVSESRGCEVRTRRASRREMQCDSLAGETLYITTETQGEPASLQSGPASLFGDCLLCNSCSFFSRWWEAARRSMKNARTAGIRAGELHVVYHWIIHQSVCSGWNTGPVL